MANDFFTKTGVPSTGAAGTSSTIRAEIALIEAAFDKMPTLTANGSKAVAINAGATALEAVAVTGTGSFVRASSPTLVTPVLGVATATSINKITFTQPATSATLTIADGKTLTASNTITFTATDGATLAIGAGGTLGTGAYATIANYAPLASPAFTGYVGIGNSSAADMDALNGAGRLVVGDGSAASTGATIYGTTLGVIAFADALTAGGSAAGSIVYDHSTDTLTLSTATAAAVTVKSTGSVLIGTTTATKNLRLEQKLATVAIGSGVFAGHSITSYVGASASGGSLLDLQRSRGATDGTMTAVASGDVLGNVVFRGSDGTNFVPAASIFAQVGGTPGANDMPGELVFGVTPDGSAAPTVALRIDAAHNFRINDATVGTNAVGVLSIANATAPTTGPADTVQFYSSDESAGHTIPSFYCEGTNVLATGQADSASSVRVKIRVNGTVVTLLAI